jgi:outer membrane immunogenic protein
MARLRQVVLCGAMLAAGTVGPALAADLPAPAPPPPQAPAVYLPPAPLFSWTGFYVGANAGWGWESASGNITNAGLADTFSVKGNGFIGGGQLGGNYQWGNGVFGLEADFQGSAGSGTLTDGNAAISATAKNPWAGTVRGRVGYAFDRILFYGTGGVVYGSQTLNGVANGVGFSTSSTYVTWTAGAGVEWAFYGPWSAKLEYLYIGSPSTAPTIPGVTGGSGSASTNIVRAGLNYHF